MTIMGIDSKEKMLLNMIIEDIGYMEILISSNSYLETFHHLITQILYMDHDYEHSFIRDEQIIRKESFLKLFEVFGRNSKAIEYRSRYKDGLTVRIEYSNRPADKNLRVPSSLSTGGLGLEKGDIDLILDDLAFRKDF